MHSSGVDSPETNFSFLSYIFNFITLPKKKLSGKKNVFRAFTLLVTSSTKEAFSPETCPEDI